MHKLFHDYESIACSMLGGDFQVTIVLFVLCISEVINVFIRLFLAFHLGVDCEVRSVITSCPVACCLLNFSWVGTVSSVHDSLEIVAGQPVH